MKRKSEQGSMQLQGEVQELLLEEMLQATFPSTGWKKSAKVFVAPTAYSLYATSLATKPERSSMKVSAPKTSQLIG